jgi:hypothetical protein
MVWTISVPKLDRSIASGYRQDHCKTLWPPQVGRPRVRVVICSPQTMAIVTLTFHLGSADVYAAAMKRRGTRFRSRKMG